MYKLGGRKFAGGINPELEENSIFNAALFTGSSLTCNTYRILYDDQKEIGGVCWEKHENLIYIDMFIADSDYMNLSANFHVAALFVNRLIKDYHPDKFIYNGTNSLVRKALRMNLFYPKGKLMQRIVEPYRYAVKDRAFDEEGYIINQALLEVLPFGFFDTKSKGCGWISAYNLLKMNGREMTMFDVANSVGDHDLLGEMFGHSVYGLYWWLKKKGLNVHLTQLVKELCVSKMKTSEAGIFLYHHKRGAHFVTYRRIADDRYRFFNAAYGVSQHDMTIEEFMDQFTVLPISNLIWMEQLEIH